jgi:WD40 repeat protein
MGVTCFEFNPLKYTEFATGCYDEKMRIWDIRKLDKEIISLKREGGVWRTIWD